MKLSMSTILILTLLLIKFSDSARILASVGTPSFSHQVAFRPIWKELAKRGHEIVLLTTDPMKESIENIKQIDLNFAYEIMNKHNFSFSATNELTDNPLEFIEKCVQVFNEVQKEEILHPTVQKLIKNDQFDLLMIEIAFPTHLGISEVFKVPFIGLYSLEATLKIHELMGNEVRLLLHHEVGLPDFPFPPTFLERVKIVLLHLFMNIYGDYYMAPKLDASLKEVFGENTKSLNELANNIDMLFINTNPVFHSIRAVTPNTILFGGGTHVDKTPKPLPEGLKKFLDSAKNGFIYLSLGSNVKSKLLKDDLKKIFIDTFKELPYKVLWKFEDDQLPNKPENVMINKWLPQGDVLRHPNIKLFITQCGLQSMEEAIINQVPMVGLPFFADQPANAEILHNKGFGIRLEHTTLTKEIFKNTLVEVITNPQYKEKVTEIADLMTDVEMTGLEKVVWWTEYVIRNKGAKLFKNPIRDLPSYQYYLLDVIAFVSAIIFIISFGTYKLSSYAFRRIFSCKSKKD